VIAITASGREIRATASLALAPHSPPPFDDPTFDQAIDTPVRGAACARTELHPLKQRRDFIVKMRSPDIKPASFAGPTAARGRVVKIARPVEFDGH
jgi:hypothetical protein